MFAFKVHPIRYDSRLDAASAANNNTGREVWFDFANRDTVPSLIPLTKWIPAVDDQPAGKIIHSYRFRASRSRGNDVLHLMIPINISQCNSHLTGVAHRIRIKVGKRLVV